MGKGVRTLDNDINLYSDCLVELGAPLPGTVVIGTKEFALYVLDQIALDAKETFRDKFCDAILFGSYAKGEQHGDSDIDICVVLDTDSRDIYHRSRGLTQRSLDLLTEYGVDPTLFKCSLTEFNNSISLIYEEIRRYGISWKELRGKES